MPKKIEITNNIRRLRFFANEMTQMVTTLQALADTSQTSQHRVDDMLMHTEELYQRMSKVDREMNAILALEKQ